MFGAKKHTIPLLIALRCDLTLCINRRLFMKKYNLLSVMIILSLAFATFTIADQNQSGTTDDAFVKYVKFSREQIYNIPEVRAKLTEMGITSHEHLRMELMFAVDPLTEGNWHIPFEPNYSQSYPLHWDMTEYSDLIYRNYFKKEGRKEDFLARSYRYMSNEDNVTTIRFITETDDEEANPIAREFFESVRPGLNSMDPVTRYKSRQALLVGSAAMAACEQDLVLDAREEIEERTNSKFVGDVFLGAMTLFRMQLVMDNNGFAVQDGLPPVGGVWVKLYGKEFENSHRSQSLEFGILPYYNEPNGNFNLSMNSDVGCGFGLTFITKW